MKGVQLEFPEPGLLVPGPLAMCTAGAKLLRQNPFEMHFKLCRSLVNSANAGPERAVSSRICEGMQSSLSEAPPIES